MDENLDELTRQLEMLNDLPSEDELMNSLGGQVQPVQPIVNQQPIQQAVPQPVQMPVYTPENPTNMGVVTNTVVPTAQPIQQVIQQQINEQAQAQVVQPTTTQSIVNPQPVQQVIQQPVQQVVQQPVQTAPVDLSIFDKENDEPVFVNIGEAVQENKMPFVDLKPGEATRIMLFTKEMLTVHTHFIKDLGFIRCLSRRDDRGYVVDKAPCCMFKDDEDKEIYAKIKRILPVIEYPVSKDGKSLLANGVPQLKFMVITLADLKSLNAILLDEDKARAAMGFDFFVTIDKDDRFKTKVFSSTFNTMRGQWANEINSIIQNFNRESLVQARDEKFRKVPVEKIQQALQREEAAKQVANQFANNQTPMFGSAIQ